MPEAEVDARVAMYSEEAEDDLLQGSPDFVLDAIDNIDTKVALLAACKGRGIPVLCAAGAGVTPPMHTVSACAQSCGCKLLSLPGSLRCCQPCMNKLPLLHESCRGH